MKKLKVMLGLAFFISILFSNTANASESNTAIFSNSERVLGIEANSLDELSTIDSPQNSNVYINNVKLYATSEQYILEGNMEINNKDIDFKFSGNLYKNVGLENCSTSGDLVLGEFIDNGNYHIAQFKIEKEYSRIVLILQEKNSLKLYQFNLNIDNQIFNEISNSIKNNIQDELLEKKIISLYSVRSNLINKSDAEDSKKFSGSGKMSEGASYAAKDFSGWNKLIKDLNAKGSVKLSNYDNIDASYFKGGGWKHDIKKSGAQYAFSIYSSANGSSEYISQFTLIDVVSHVYDTGSNELFYIKNMELYFSFVDGMMVTYNKNTDILKVKFYGMGLSLSNVKLAIGNLPQEGFMISRKVNISGEQSPNVLRAAIGLYDVGEKFVNIFEHLQPYESQKLESVKLFEDTYEAQWNKYGKIIRAIATDSGANKITKKNHYVYIQGDASYIKDTPSEKEYQFLYTAHHNL